MDPLGWAHTYSIPWVGLVLQSGHLNQAYTKYVCLIFGNYEMDPLGWAHTHSIPWNGLVLQSGHLRICGARPTQKS